MHFLKNRLLEVRFSISFLMVFSFSFLQNVTAVAQEKKYVVVLDAGHGGGDPGNIGNGYREKTIALNVVKNLGGILKKEKDIKVIYTRQNDTFINLWKRGEIANKAKADLFISVHCDSHTSNAYGAGTFVLGLHANKQNFEIAKKENAVILLEEDYKNKYKGFDPNSPESVIGLTVMQEENLDKSLVLASTIQDNFQKRLKRKNRGVKQAGFVVLHQTFMPSILIELGFLTNKTEGRYLNSKKGQQEMASAISVAVKKYFSTLKANTVLEKEKTEVVVKKDTINVKPKEKTDIDESVIFKVQIASSKRKIRTKSYNFKGLKNIERVKIGKFYKYYYGISNNYQQTKQSLILAKNKGYNSAFIAAFKDGKKVSLTEILK